MKITCEFDTDDIGHSGEGYPSFEGLLNESLRERIISDARTKLNSDKFDKFVELTSENIVNEIKLKFIDFLDEEIVLTDRWGKPHFIGNIDDLLKSKIDMVLLRPVDNYGKTIEGCTTQGQTTWIEWQLKETMTKDIKEHIASAQKSISKDVKRTVEEALEKYTKDIINESVSASFDS